jgi:hypothetical protein
LARIDGLVSASILAMILAGAFGGALGGLVLASMLSNQVWLAIITAFVAVVISLVVRQVIFASHVPHSIPLGLRLWHVIVASLIGGLSGHELAIDLREPPVSPLIGATSGLIASVLISTFIITLSYRRS